MTVHYEAAHRIACAQAITALGSTIGLYRADGTRIGTVAGTTTWGTPTTDTYDGHTWARSTGSTVTITIPAGTVAQGTVIARYGVLNGATLLRTQDLPVALTINDNSEAVQIDVTPAFAYRGE